MKKFAVLIALLALALESQPPKAISPQVSPACDGVLPASVTAIGIQYEDGTTYVIYLEQDDGYREVTASSVSQEAGIVIGPPPDNWTIRSPGVGLFPGTTTVILLAVSGWLMGYRRAIRALPLRISRRC